MALVMEPVIRVSVLRMAPVMEEVPSLAIVMGTVPKVTANVVEINNQLKLTTALSMR